MVRATVAIAALACAIGPAHAWAQDEGESEEALDVFDEESEGGSEDGEAGDDETDEAGASGPRRWWFGPYVRLNFVPIDVLGGFWIDEAPTVFSPGFGIAANYRSDDGPSFQVGIGYLGYSVDGPFRSSGDPVQDTEWVESDLGLIHLTGSMLWHTDFSDVVSFEYGFGLDLGVVTGELVRSEAFQDANGEWGKCAAPLSPPNISPSGEPFCEGNPVAFDEEGAHYNVVDERVPPIAAGVMLPHLTLRIQPTEDLAFKGEFAFGLLQFWFGVSAAYAPEL